MPGLRVLVAEDHDVMRGIVVALLSSEYQIVGAVADGKQLVEAALFLQPDLIVSDIRMSVMDGLAAKAALRSHSIRCPFVFMTLMELGPLPIPADELIGFVHKTDIFFELKQAIQSVVNGKSYLSQSIRKP